MATLLELMAKAAKAQTSKTSSPSSALSSSAQTMRVAYPDWLKAIDGLVRAAWSSAKLGDEGYDGIEGLPDLSARALWKAGLSPVEALQHANTEWATAAVKSQMARLARGSLPIQQAPKARAKSYALGRIPVGTRVLFGRDNGEQTLGEIVSIGSSRYKIRQLEPRGSMRDYVVGSLWNIPFRLATVEDRMPILDRDEDRAPRAKPRSNAGAAMRQDLSGITIGNVFSAGIRQFRVVEFQPNRPRYPVVAVRIPDGKRFKFTVLQVLGGS